ncbi:hypothetical protein ASPSYDRAFT_33920 [Aspergillus sydowii CBS 593.65]|uniref:Uncharacterized protein n=1 Tax=Aspergillus sydowii CBS 593.65 TaxID=1036612 RepID=A0A1L9T8Z0_9EURO|nr:uncharacterized protein ASPSYDRAFT_33920 [Aspergillus sydowii CBS 593.65]OJJ55910.1 hypothetical protein ASPSYDRAFT_33920 [Aspergillus sydowii CBS 593.65]
MSLQSNISSNSCLHQIYSSEGSQPLRTPFDPRYQNGAEKPTVLVALLLTGNTIYYTPQTCSPGATTPACAPARRASATLLRLLVHAVLLLFDQPLDKAKSDNVKVWPDGGQSREFFVAEALTVSAGDPCDSKCRSECLTPPGFDFYCSDVYGFERVGGVTQGGAISGGSVQTSGSECDSTCGDEASQPTRPPTALGKVDEGKLILQA